MGNDHSKQNVETSSGTRQNKTIDRDLPKEDLSEYQPISYPPSPENTVPTTNTGLITDEMSYSGILVEPPSKGGAAAAAASAAAKHLDTASAFSSPIQPVAAAAGASPSIPASGRRIVKATHPPPPPAGHADTYHNSSHETNSKVDHSNTRLEGHHHHGKQHLPAVLSHKASTELLEESIEQSKTKRLEQRSRDQKSKRDKLLEERRKIKPLPTDQTSSTTSKDDSTVTDNPPPSKKSTPQPNPFSKFLRVFSVEPAFPHHKRAYEESDVDAQQQQQQQVPSVAPETGTHDTGPVTSAATSSSSEGRSSPASMVTSHNESKRMKLDDATSQNTNENDRSDIKNALLWLSSLVEAMPEWVPTVAATAGMTVVAVMVAWKFSTLSSGPSKSG
jgi:hypothetical protein